MVHCAKKSNPTLAHEYLILLVKVLGAVSGGPTGQLGVEVTTSTNLIHRGDVFNVDMKIQNPFDELVKITDCQWELPPGLSLESIGESFPERAHSALQPGDSCAISFGLSSSGPLRTFRFRDPNARRTNTSNWNTTVYYDRSRSTNFHSRLPKVLCRECVLNRVAE